MTKKKVGKKAMKKKATRGGPIGRTGLPFSFAKGTDALTDEEKVELENLEAAFKEEKFLLKKNVFKGLPPHIRQEVVDQLLLVQACKDMNHIDNFTKFNQRLAELKHKTDPYGGDMEQNRTDKIPFPEFTVKQACDMHSEACADEILGVKDE